VPDSISSGTTKIRYGPVASAAAAAVEGALQGGVVGSELGHEGGHRGAAGRGQQVRDLVGVDDGGAARGEQVGDGGLAAADATSEPDRKCADPGLVHAASPRTGP
jgi:hypothetical protein